MQFLPLLIHNKVPSQAVLFNYQITHVIFIKCTPSGLCDNFCHVLCSKFKQSNVISTFRNWNECCYQRIYVLFKFDFVFVRAIHAHNNCSTMGSTLNQTGCRFAFYSNDGISLQTRVVQWMYCRWLHNTFVKVGVLNLYLCLFSTGEFVICRYNLNTQVCVTIFFKSENDVTFYSFILHSSQHD